MPNLSIFPYKTNSGILEILYYIFQKIMVFIVNNIILYTVDIKHRYWRFKRAHTIRA